MDHRRAVGNRQGCVVALPLTLTIAIAIDLAIAVSIHRRQEGIVFEGLTTVKVFQVGFDVAVAGLNMRVSTWPIDLETAIGSPPWVSAA